MLCWAMSIVIVRDVAGTVPPAAMSFLRCLLALCLLYPICRRALHAQMPLMLKHWKIIGFQGVLLFIGGNGMLFVGLHKFTTAINGALINSAEPVTIVAVAWVMFRDRLTLIQWAGVFLSMVGVIYLVGRGNLSVLLSLDLNIGDVFIFISIVSWAFYAVLMRKVPPELDRLNVVFGILVAGDRRFSILDSGKHFLQSNAAYLGNPVDDLLQCGIRIDPCAVLVNHTVEGLGPGRAGLFIHLIPVYTVILAVWLLGERLFMFHAIGIGLIAIGIFLTTVLRTKPERAA